MHQSNTPPSEAYLEPNQTSTLEIFNENREYRNGTAVKYFRKEAPS